MTGQKGSSFGWRTLESDAPICKSTEETGTASFRENAAHLGTPTLVVPQFAGASEFQPREMHFPKAKRWAKLSHLTLQGPVKSAEASIQASLRCSKEKRSLDDSWRQDMNLKAIRLTCHQFAKSLACTGHFTATG